MRKIVFIICTLVCFFLVFYGNGYARVSGPCSDCHTMHNSQDGSPVARGDAAWGEAGGSTDNIPSLLVSSCLGCHSSTGTETIETLPGGAQVPIVFNTSSVPTKPLAGGNFYWVQSDDTKGHNVLIGNPDDLLTFAPGTAVGCGVLNSCHSNISGTVTWTIDRQGCTKCHMMNDAGKTSGFHHADDSDTVVGSVIDDTDGFYRFLTGHFSGSGHGVSGIEDDDWEQNTAADNHNEYLGNQVALGSPGNFSALGHTMTGFCCGCHGNFHIEQTGGTWIRHPSDAILPNTGEYSDAFGAGGTGLGTYDPQVPVAREEADLSGGVSSDVNLDHDMVMCLSCHRPHGSPYPDMLRWDYDTMNAGGGGSGGCFTCHTQKN